MQIVLLLFQASLVPHIIRIAISSLIVKRIDQIGLLESLYLVDQLQTRLHYLFPHHIAKTADLSPVWQMCYSLKICSKFTRKHPCQNRNFIEITLWHGCSAVNLLHVFRTRFPKNTSNRLLLRLLATVFKPVVKFCSKLSSKVVKLPLRTLFPFCKEYLLWFLLAWNKIPQFSAIYFSFKSSLTFLYFSDNLSTWNICSQRQ